MSGIVTALVASHDVEAFREEIDDFAFTLVAPLRAEDDYVSHFDQTYLVYRKRKRKNGETEKRRSYSQDAPVHDTLALYADFRCLHGNGPGCVCTTDPGHFHRQAQGVPDLRGVQGARAPDEGEY